MKKNELIDEIVEKAGITKAQAGLALDAFLSAITESLSQKKEFRIMGFGAFKVNYRKERNGRNPKTGEKMTIPACYIPTFTAGKSLKELIKGSEVNEKKIKKSISSEKRKQKTGTR